METPAWILVIILSITLFIFLIVGIILLISLIRVTKEAKKIMIQGQNIAETAGDIAENVRDFTTVGGLVRYFVDNYMDGKERRTNRRKSSAASKRKVNSEVKAEEEKEGKE